ncbi:MAG: FAD-binding oxidoreductase [Sandaracinaceae bacterium]|nr:FAD-binding oxidoreductase [Sandaracinaceae bacterium]
MTRRRDALRWNGWGLADKTFDLHGRDEEVWTVVREALGMSALPSTPAVPLDAVALAEPQLDGAFLERLRALTAPERVLTSAFERALHAVGKSYYDLVRARAGELPDAPDAVVYPEGHAEVVAVLAACAEADVAVVPFGGGSSVVGGVEARRAGHAGLVTLDTTRMDRLLELDETSHTATFEAGIYGPALEAKLAERGYTLGHFPQSFEFSTLGGWIAARGAGQQSNRYGAAAKLLLGARVATPRGEWRTQPFPGSAAGPDLNHLIAGSEGCLGVITEATVKIHPLAEARDFVSFLFRSWESGTDAVRRITQAELPIATLRLSDAEETRFYGAFNAALRPSKVQEVALDALGAVGFDAPCVLMVGFEGSAASVRATWRSAFALAARAGGLYVGRGPGNRWYEHRFEMPYLRDPMLDRGVGIDTLETSTSWSNVDRLYRAVTGAIRGALEAGGHPGVVLAHISHTYLSGTSLYFTFVFPRDLDDPVGQWRAAKDAASRAISEHGGTISHHHGVGTDHAPWIGPELGALGVDVLTAAKERLDPSGIMNPGKLLPPTRA